VLALIFRSYGVVLLERSGLSKEKFDKLIAQSSRIVDAEKQVKDQIESLFIQLKPPSPTPLQISKATASSFKLVYKKYLALIRFKTYHESKAMPFPPQRYAIHKAFLDDESLLREVLSSY